MLSSVGFVEFAILPARERIFEQQKAFKRGVGSGEVDK
jgi:hypothetical protein